MILARVATEAPCKAAWRRQRPCWLVGRGFFVSRASCECEYRVSRNRPATPYTLTRLQFRRPKFQIAVVSQHVCIFGTDIDVFEIRTILTIVGVFGDLRRCTGLQHDARTRSAGEITVGDASRGDVVANCL